MAEPKNRRCAVSAPEEMLAESAALPIRSTPARGGCVGKGRSGWGRGKGTEDQAPRLRKRAGLHKQCGHTVYAGVSHFAQHDLRTS
jgi:hypothetical protein